MKSIKEYIAESATEHAYILKMSIEPSADQLKTVESLLSAYDLVHFSDIRKVENERFDFFDIDGHDVYSIRFVTLAPVSSYMLTQQLKDVLNIPEKYIVVRASNEPVEVEAEDERFKQIADADADAAGLKSGPRLSIKRFYDDAEQPIVTDLYGDTYNKNFLEYLATIKGTRATDEVDPPMPLFSWLDMNKIKSSAAQQDATDFNAQYNTPKPVYKAKANSPLPVKPTALGTNGNLDDGAAQNVRLFVNPKTGAESAMTATRAAKKAKR